VLLILALLSWTTVSSFSVLEIIALSEKLPLSEISRDVEVVVAKAVDAKELKSNAPADTAEAILILLIILNLLTSFYEFPKLGALHNLRILVARV